MTKKKTHNKKRGNGFKTAGWLTVSLFLAGLAVMAGLYLEKNTRVSGVDFSGNYFTPEDALISAIDAPVGVLADSVNYRELFSAISSLPYVESVNLSMGFRGVLNFEISERDPLALLADGSNRVYVAEGGFKLPIIPEKIKDVPILYGFPAEPLADTLNSHAYQQVENFLLEARKNEFAWATISEVTWTTREGITALSHENGVKLVFGENNFEEKLRHWQEFYGEIIAKQGIRSFRSVDLRFRNQIVTKKS